MSRNCYHVGNDVRIKVFRMFGRTPEEADKDVKVISEWVKTQHHFPEVMEEVKIRNFLILCKFSVEKTKQKIDMYYTIRSLIPDWFDSSNPKLPAMKYFMEQTINASHPVLMEDGYRLFFLKPLEPNSYTPVEQILQCFNIYEIRLYEDCMVGDIMIIDMINITLNDLRKVTPMVLTKGFTVYQKVYCQRLKAIYLINSPPYVDFVLKTFKAVLKPKIFERIHVCKDTEILTEILSKDVLPQDYGGEGLSLKELNELMKLKFEEYQSRFDALDKLRVNESLRPEKLSNDDMLGYYGNFKQLNVD